MNPAVLAAHLLLKAKAFESYLKLLSVIPVDQVDKAIDQIQAGLNKTVDAIQASFVAHIKAAQGVSPTPPTP